MAKDKFDNFEDTNPTKGGVYLLPGPKGSDGEPTPGNYVVEIDAVKEVENWQGKGFTVIELTVVESNVESRPTGTQASWVLKDDDPMFGPNFKAFLMAAFKETDPKQIDKRVGQLVLSEKQPLAGKQVAVEVVQILTKKEKKDFNKHNWFAYEPEATKKSA